MGTANSFAMLRLLLFLMPLSVRALRAIFRTRGGLLIENLALRQQVAALKKGATTAGARLLDPEQT